MLNILFMPAEQPPNFSPVHQQVAAARPSTIANVKRESGTVFELNSILVIVPKFGGGGEGRGFCKKGRFPVISCVQICSWLQRVVKEQQDFVQF